jgi:maltose alpha-D-glucosyltransferase/alpha-amylase
MMDQRATPATADTVPSAKPSETSDADALWYKDAIIYELHVKAFHDSDGDGIGDFRGLTEKLDYIQHLGVNTVWLLPFYPSPMRDDGYDVSDYHNIHPAYGTRLDFRTFVREAHRRGLRIITELIINHTSDQHAWFQAARRAPAGSAKREYYVWSDTAHRYAGTRVIFTDTETSNWAWDDVAKAYYWHRFFSHQPDLNFDNPRVLKAFFRVMRFWLDMGVDGFRLDAIPYLVEREGTINENLPETHRVIKQIREALDRHYTGRMLLAEANQWPEDVREYFGAGDECHMAFHFPLMPRLFMAIAREDRHPVVDIMSQTPEVPSNCQWSIFLRNHDELTLEMVTDRERDYMYKMFAADPQMRVNVGIRRRLAPLMENSRPQIELISFLLMTLPGSPVLYYGDEIGMGDNIYLGDRNGVRTPMQWSPDRNAGFSRADPQRLYLPPIMDPVYGYQSVNVEAQLRSGSSLLNWTRRLISTRAQFKVFGRGTLSFLRPGNRKVLVFLREYGGESVLCVANLSRHPQAVELDLGRFEGRVPVEIMGSSAFPPIGKLPYLLTLAGHGYFAFRLAADVAAPQWHEERLPYNQLPVLVLADGWRSYFAATDAARDIGGLLRNTTHERLMDEILLPYLRSRRWFAAKGRRVAELDIAETVEWNTPEGSWLMAFVAVELENAPPQLYFFPLSIAWETRGYDPLENLGIWSFARVRHRERVGVAYDPFGNPRFTLSLIRAIGEGLEIPMGLGRLRFQPTSRFPRGDQWREAQVKLAALEQSNTSVFIAEQMHLKGYRLMHPGVNPEAEIGRFLTEVSPYPQVAPLLGTVEYTSPEGELSTLALLQGFVRNQGDLWVYTLEYLERFLSAHMAAAEGTQAPPADSAAHGFYLVQIEKLGQRIGELHAAFDSPNDDPAFRPEQAGNSWLAACKDSVRIDAEGTFARLDAALPDLPEPVRPIAQAVIDNRAALLAAIDAIEADARGLHLTRYHGDLHLGQILIVKDDFVIIDFEGEPEKPIEERRRKHSPLRDVAGILRSLAYAVQSTIARTANLQALDPRASLQLLEEWRAAASRMFMQGYRQTTASTASVPADSEALRSLLALFSFERTFYELRYELDNRPESISVPLRGLIEMAANAGEPIPIAAAVTR